MIKWIVFSVVVSCVTPQKKEENKDDGKKSTKAEQANEDEFYVSGNLNTLTMSLSNNPQTSRRVDRKDADVFADKLQQAIRASKGDDRKSLVALMSLRRISGEGLGKVTETARQLVELEMKKDVNRGLPEFAKLELVLAAIQAKKYSYAEHFIYDLLDSKNKKVKAAALTAEGLIAALDQRLPEAMVSWTKALDEVPNFPAAALNIGFYAAKFGDFPLAKKMLGSMQDDWFAAYGLASTERMLKDNDKATSLCRFVNEKKPRFKPALFNCALHAFQGSGDIALAHQLLDRAGKVSGQSEIDEKIFQLREMLARAKPKEVPKAADPVKPQAK